MAKSNETKDSRKRIELCDWNETLHVTALNKGDHYSAKAKSRGSITEGEIAARAGHETPTHGQDARGPSDGTAHTGTTGVSPVGAGKEATR